MVLVRSNQRSERVSTCHAGKTLRAAGTASRWGFYQPHEQVGGTRPNSCYNVNVRPILQVAKQLPIAR